MADTPPYQNDALRYVAVEVRFPLVDDSDPQHWTRFREAVHEDLPVAQEEQQLNVTVGPTGPSAQQLTRQRLSARDRISSAVLGRDVLVLETTEYPGWTEFQERFARLLTSLEEVRRPDGVLRIGLRFIDEIRVPGVQKIADWRGWVSDALVAPFILDELEPSAATVALQYGAAPGLVTTFRAAPFASGRTVQEDGPLRLPFDTPEGAYFLLDTDASWTDPHAQVPEFDVASIVAILTELHEPCHRLFEAAITDRLRDDVLRRPREEVWASNG
jgi:uncharacterized protein (TIGR04255 family)